MDLSALFNALNDIFIDFGGHECAAGFSFRETRLDEFQKRLKNYLKEVELVKKEEILNIDAEIPPAYMGPELKDILDRLAPYGIEFEPLVFLSRDLTVENTEVMGRNGSDHLKLLIGGTKCKWPAVFWNSAGRYRRDFETGDVTDIVFKLRKNYYMNSETLQLNIIDITKKDGKKDHEA